MADLHAAQQQELSKKIASLEATIASQKEELARNKEALARVTRDLVEVIIKSFLVASR